MPLSGGGCHALTWRSHGHSLAAYLSRHLRQTVVLPGKCTVCCAFTEAYPLGNKEAETIAKALNEQLFCRFRPPLSILSDQGKEVDERIMNEVCRLFGVAKLRTTSCKPSTNQVERFHRTMNAILAKTIDEHQRDWDSQLPVSYTHLTLPTNREV